MTTPDQTQTDRPGSLHPDCSEGLRRLAQTLRDWSDDAIHTTLVTREDLAALLHAEAEILLYCREHGPVPNAPDQRPGK